MRVVNDYWRVDMLFWEVRNGPLQPKSVSLRWVICPFPAQTYKIDDLVVSS